ncbi:hypothetical protein WG66_009213 [Moniliophthora roreri]|nr:hypothetical protein WG66_009213 [Moniliophthora roreri]
MGSMDCFWDMFPGLRRLERVARRIFVLARRLWHSIDEVEPDASTPTRLEMAYMVSGYEPSPQVPVGFVPPDLYTFEIVLRWVKIDYKNEGYIFETPPPSTSRRILADSFYPLTESICQTLRHDGLTVRIPFDGK